MRTTNKLFAFASALALASIAEETMMKNRLVIWTCTLALLLSSSASLQADYKGTLRADEALTANVDNSTGGPTAITIYYIGKGRIEDIEMTTVPPGTRNQYVFSKPGRGIKRVLFDVEPPSGNVLGIEINGFVQSCQGHTTLMFDVE